MDEKIYRHLHRARSSANGAVSTLSYAMEQPDPVKYMQRWAESVQDDLREAQLELNKILAIVGPLGDEPCII